MRHLPPLNTLKIFEAAARNESFAVAAEELFVTASAVSHQIKSLEQNIGRKLFKRNKRKVELTPLGEKYLTSVKRALNEIDVATQNLRAEDETDIVRLNIAPNFLMRWLIPRLADFQAQYPAVELQIYAAIDLTDFKNSDIDMAVYFGSVDQSEIEVHFLSKVFLTPVYTPSLIQPGKPIKTPEDLKNYTLIHIPKRLYEWAEWIQMCGLEYSGFDRGMHFSSSQLATAAAREGLGVALTDVRLLTRQIASGELIQPFEATLDTNRGMYLLYPKKRVLSYGMKVFKDWLIDAIQSQSSETIVPQNSK